MFGLWTQEGLEGNADLFEAFLLSGVRLDKSSKLATRCLELFATCYLPVGDAPQLGRAPSVRATAAESPSGRANCR